MIKKMSRRNFTRKLVAAPLAIAGGQIFGAQIGALPSQDKRKPKTDAEYNRHPPIVEPDPFSAPLTFTRREVNPKVRPFALDQVLLDAGPMQQARNLNRAYMMRLSNDRLLHNFRVTAGISSSVEPLGGWESPKAELRGHFVGHYLSACALLYASTGDSQVKQKADDLVGGIAECQTALAAGGYVSAFPEELFVRLDRREKVWAPFYTLHKIMAGMVDMNTLAGNAQALDVAKNLAGWVDRWTSERTEEHMQEILKTEFGGMNDVLYNLAAVTNDDRWVNTGDRFTKKSFFTPLAMRRDELKGLHANTHMPQVIGAARRYDLSSDHRFGDVSEFFWDTVTETRTYAPGGSANTESWLTNSGRLALEMKASSHHQECCCSYNMMKLSRMLYGRSADPRYIDYYERNLLNHRLGTMEPETGHTSYFLSMTPGAWKTTCTEDQTFWCCTGSALEEFAKLNDTIYYHDEANIYVNLFVPSRLHWESRGIRLQQSTRFPENNRTLITVHAARGEVWTMYVRIPVWTTEENQISINGFHLPTPGTPGSYVALKRQWKSGDRVELSLPMQLSVEILPDDPSQQAFLYGPLVLAGQFPRGELSFDLQHNQAPEPGELPPFELPNLVPGGRSLSEWIKPAAGQPLTFRVTGQEQSIELKPLNQSWERFTVYWSVS